MSIDRDRVLQNWRWRRLRLSLLLLLERDNGAVQLRALLEKSALASRVLAGTDEGGVDLAQMSNVFVQQTLNFGAASASRSDAAVTEVDLDVRHIV